MYKKDRNDTEELQNYINIFFIRTRLQRLRTVVVVVVVVVYQCPLNTEI